MEIGSEFEWCEDCLSNTYNSFSLPYSTNGIFTFSGRTSIEQILKVIKKKERALLPSYCCDSMIEPFRKAGVKVYFYDVFYDSDSLKININKEQISNIDILLLMNYFGFVLDVQKGIIQKFKNNNGIVIEDITHSLLSEHQYHDFSDYVVASLRKWGSLLDGGYCSSKKSKLKECKEKPNKVFLQKKKEAMIEKYDYLYGKNINKSSFLELFNFSNQFFSSDYSNTSISKISYDVFMKLPIEEMRAKRVNNAKVLYEELSNLKEIQFLFPIERMDCPLFIPILLAEKYRTALRNHLIKDAIYCPVHWPKPREILNSSLYEEELSLVCDQRYDELDMTRIANNIKDYFGY